MFQFYFEFVILDNFSKFPMEVWKTQICNRLFLCKIHFEKGIVERFVTLFIIYVISSVIVLDFVFKPQRYILNLVLFIVKEVMSFLQFLILLVILLN